LKFAIQTGVNRVLEERDRTAGLFRNCDGVSQWKKSLQL